MTNKASPRSPPPPSAGTPLSTPGPPSCLQGSQLSLDPKANLLHNAVPVAGQGRATGVRVPPLAPGQRDCLLPWNSAWTGLPAPARAAPSPPGEKLSLHPAPPSPPARRPGAQPGLSPPPPRAFPSHLKVTPENDSPLPRPRSPSPPRPPTHAALSGSPSPPSTKKWETKIRSWDLGFPPGQTPN